MYCVNCGNEIDENAVVCIHCGVPTRKMQQAVNVPVNQPKVTNGFGIAGFVIGLVSIWFGAFFCIPAIIGLIFSIIGMSYMKKCNSANGLAIAGLVLSIFATCLWAFFWIVMAGAAMM